ncbi:MAG: hypothetical protein JXA69_17080 [Phycisphaerae bacterium]|nr:hypothetical protein [Phycisphaerae bacterium]
MKPDLIDRLDAIRDRLHRWRWRIRLVVAVLLLPSFGHFAYTRWTGRPPKAFDGPLYDMLYGLDPEPLRPPPEVDRTDDLVAAVKRLPPLPTITAPTSAPAGMQWMYRSRWGGAFPIGGDTLMPLAATSGEWTPATRHHLSEIVAHIESPAVAVVLDEIVALSASPFCVPAETTQDAEILWRLSEITMLLVARARYWVAEWNDGDRAARDIRGVLQLVAGVEDDGTARCVWRGVFDRSPALQEIRYWVHDGTLGPQRCRDLIAWLGTHPFDARKSWETMLRCDYQQATGWLDYAYTRNQDDDGWIVFFAQDHHRLADQMLPSLNLLSVFFDDRRTVRARMQSMSETLVSLGHLPFRDAVRVLDAHAKARSKPTDCFMFLLERFCQYSPSRRALLVDLARTQASHLGTMTVLALEVYKRDHGQYPEDLAALVPQYSPTIPIDPFNEVPLRYRLDGRGGYVLYSVDDDGMDDGGIVGEELMLLGHRGARFDFPLSEPRGDLYTFEWFLVPGDPADSRDDEDGRE